MCLAVLPDAAELHQVIAGVSGDVVLKPGAQVVDLPAALAGVVRRDVDLVLRVRGEHGVIDMGSGIGRPSQ